MSGRPISKYSALYVRTRALNYMTAAIRVLRMGAPVLDETTGESTAVYTEIVYQGKARVWSVEAAGVLELGDGRITTRQTNVSIPWDATPVPKNDDMVIVDDFGGDVDLDTQAFRIIGVDGGGLIRAARRLTCIEWTPDRYWGET